MTATTTIPITVLIVEDNEFLRLGLKAALSAVNAITIVGEACNGEQAIELYQQLQPDIVLMDINMPVMNGIESTKAIKQINTTSKVIMLTSHDEDEEVYSALSAGASGYCLKDVALARLHEAIRAVYSGDLWLDSAIAGKVVRLCSQTPQTQNDTPNKTAAADTGGKSSNVADGNLTNTELQIMNMLVKGFTTSDIAARLNLPFSTAKTHVVNVLNKVTAIEDLSAGGSGDYVTQQTDAPDKNLGHDSTLLEKYELIGKLGTGGTSIVYKARHKMLDRLVAIKLLSGQAYKHPGMQERFILEAKITSSMSHPNIITVHDFGISHDGQPYLVMDFVDGPTLSQLLERGGPVEEKEAVRLFSQVASALSFAHSKGVVHRDIKPGNVMLAVQHGELCAKILDFGLAQVATDEENKEAMKLTQAGCVLGSPLYMSPEQCQGKPVDARSDMYSFGCLMYEVLKGAPPFKGKSVMDTMGLHVRQQPPSLDGCVTSPHLKHLVGRCLSKMPEQRFDTTQDLSRELEIIAANN